MKKMVQKVALTAASFYATAGVMAQQAMAQAVTNANLLRPAEDARQINQPRGFASDLGSVIDAVLTFVMSISALLVLMYLVWGGIEWITSGGDKGKTEKARDKITAAVIGLIVLAASYAIFRVAITFLGFNDVNDVFRVRTITPPAAG